MNNEHFHVYCKNILGVKTNVDNFKWLYGSITPNSSEKEFNDCLIKIFFCVKAEKDLGPAKGNDKRFQSYSWDSESKTIYCRRTILKKFKIGFNIRVCDDSIYAEFGYNYYKFVKNKVMNLHGVYYLLSDLANIMLIKKGYLSLYASAVYNEQFEKTILHFAPPSTGKTLVSTKLCDLLDYKLIGEDIVITDGEMLYSCPWTCSYRSGSMTVDNGGAFGRRNKIVKNNMHESSALTDIVVLSLGKNKILKEKLEILNQICILNGYMFGYYSNPIIKILAYFDENYRDNFENSSILMFKTMIDKCNSYLIQTNTPDDLYRFVHQEVTGQIS